MVRPVNVQTFRLPNGLRLVCRRTQLNADYFGVTVNVGSRDETPSTYGLAHFVEHTIFKGTSHRHASHIINRMEAVGGELNAFTTKEETNVYSAFPHGNAARAVELIADLVKNSVFPERELAKEREVVRDEIDSYLDVPSEAVFDSFEDEFYAGSQLGHNILGLSANLDGFTPDVCRRYIESYYTADRMVAYYSGRIPAERVFRLVERHFSDVAPSGEPMARIAPVAVAPFGTVRNIDSHQAHCVMGAAVPSVHSSERIALALITNILGGPGMNSRLNVALRERRGLVYAVDAGLTSFSDCGLFTVYFGSDPDDAPRCRRLVTDELDRIASEPLTERQLRMAKHQFLGQSAMASDNGEQMALNAGRSMLFLGKVSTDAEFREAVEALTAEDIMRSAAWLAADRISSLTFC